MQLDTEFISKVLRKVQIHNGPFPENSSFSVDTRTLKKSDVFVALKGAHVDGHDFIAQALQQGASGFVLDVERKDSLLKEFGSALLEKHLLFVQSPYQALIDLAKKWRSQFTYPVVAITGSVGKTTTKEMVRNILKLTEKPFVVSSGNQNTLIGASINILKMRSDHQAAVFEVGIGKRNVMTELADLVRPTYALITKVAHSHMEGLGGLASVASEKRKVFSCFSERDIGLINGDQKDLSDVSYPHPVIRFGYKTTNQIQARKIVIKNNVTTFTVKIYNDKYSAVMQGCHEGRVMNALGAIAVGYMLNIPNELLIKGVCQPLLVQGRFQIIEHKTGCTIINDGYNSNPESAKASLHALQHYETDKEKVVVLGDMLELGSESAFWHRQIGRSLAKFKDIHHIVLIGKQVEHTKKTLPLSIKATLFPDIQEAYETLRDMFLQKNKVFLFKGSNSLKFSELIDKLQNI